MDRNQALVVEVMDRLYLAATPQEEEIIIHEAIRRSRKATLLEVAANFNKFGANVRQADVISELNRMAEEKK